MSYQAAGLGIKEIFVVFFIFLFVALANQRAMLERLQSALRTVKESKRNYFLISFASHLTFACSEVCLVLCVSGMKLGHMFSMLLILLLFSTMTEAQIYRWDFSILQCGNNLCIRAVRKTLAENLRVLSGLIFALKNHCWWSTSAASSGLQSGDFMMAEKGGCYLS